MDISIESSIGQCALKIKATLKNAQAAATLAGQNLLFHKSASKAFPNGEKAVYTRKTPYSDALGAHCIAVVKEAFNGVFEITSIEASAAPASLTPKEKWVRDMVKLGIDAEAAEAGWEVAQAKLAEKAKADADAEAEVESVE